LPTRRSDAAGPLARGVLVVLLLLVGGERPLAATPPPGSPALSEQLLQLRNHMEHRDYQMVLQIADRLVPALEGERYAATPVAVEIRLARARALYGLTFGPSPEVRTAAEEALAGARALTPPCPHLTIRALVLLADTFLSDRNFTRARPLVEQAVTLAEAQLGEGHPDTWNAWRALGDLQLANGRPQEARQLLERALAAAHRLQGPASPEAAVLLCNLAAAIRRAGDVPTAREYALRALQAREEVFGPQHLLTTHAHNTLALVLRDGGDLPGARRHFERALAGFERALGREHLAVAGVLHNLGNLLRRLGDLEAAQQALQRALTIREQRLGGEHLEVAHSLNSLALVAHERGNLPLARDLLERSLQLREQHLGPQHPDLSTPLQNLAEVLSDLGEFTAARPLAERALALRTKALGEDHPKVAELQHNLALLHANLGELPQGLQLARQALATARAAGGEEHPTTATFRLTLARLQALSGELSVALDNALAAEAIARRHSCLTAHYLSEREALAFARARLTGRDLALSLAAQAAPRQRQRLWEAAAGGRGLAFAAVARRQRAAAAGDGSAEALAAVDRTRAAYAALLVRAASSEAPPTAELERARLAAEEAERRLAEQFPALAPGARLAPPAVSEAAAALPPASALVSFLRFCNELAPPPPPAWAGLPAAGRCRGPGSPEEGYAALILRAENPVPEVVDLGNAAAIDRLVARWAAEAGRNPARAERTSRRVDPVLRTVGDQLRRAVWDPLVPFLGRARLVLLVPDGELHTVSWYAFPAGRSSYLVEGETVIHLLASEDDLLELAATRPAGQGLVAVGGVNYEGRREGHPGAASPAPTPAAALPQAARRGFGVDCRSLRGAHFAPIPATAREVAAVAGLWVAAAADHQSPRAAVLTGDAATEAQLKTLAPGARVLHLATHGFFTGRSCQDEAGASRGVGGLAPTAGPVAPALTLAGLALAGANARAETRGADDGILLAEEVSTLDLRGVEWAVLSGCDTGAGSIHAGEGVVGLQRAFRLAGVRTVIMSLWGVDDEAARQWMVALYRARLLKGASTAEAVRSASRQVLAARRLRGQSAHPLFWAAFVAVGDWR